MMGDSKTTSPNWTGELITNLRSVSNWSSVNQTPTRLAQAGWTVSDLEAATPAWIAGAPGSTDVVLINIGVNDAANGTSQAVFEAKLGSILDQDHAKWATAAIFVAKVWRGDNPVWEAQCNVINDTWIPNVMASRPWALNGLDERIVIRDPDGGLSKTIDLVHYNASGDIAISNAWQTFIMALL